MVRYSTGLIAFFCILGSLSAQQELSELVDEAGAWVQWDSFRKMGIIWRQDTSLSFKVDSPYLLENFEHIHTVAAIFEESGAIVVPEPTVVVIRRIFPPRETGLPSFEGSTRVTTIFIDPGHGGRDPGAIAYYEEEEQRRVAREKDIVLQTGHYLSSLLRTRFPDKNIVLSRSDDSYVSLEERTRLANSVELAQGESMIFVSLHVNASLNKKAKGFEVWYLPLEVTRSDIVNPEQLQVKDPDVLSILNVIRDEELTIESVLLARSVLSSLNFHLGDSTLNRGLREESWYVVRNAKMPAILVELGFVSNAEERAQLIDTEYLRTAAVALYRGIRDFVENIEGKNE